VTRHPHRPQPERAGEAALRVGSSPNRPRVPDQVGRGGGGGGGGGGVGGGRRAIAYFGTGVARIWSPAHFTAVAGARSIVRRPTEILAADQLMLSASCCLVHPIGVLVELWCARAFLPQRRA